MAAFTLSVISTLFLWPLQRAQASDGITTVKLSKAGPDKLMPLREAFNLTGDLEDLDAPVSVHPIFVRYEFLPFGIARRSHRKRPASCTEVVAALGGDAQLDSKVLSAPGQTSIAQLFPTGPTKAEGASDDDFERIENHYKALKRGKANRVYVPPPWVKSTDKDAKEKAWSVFVQNKAFFRPGAKYCLMVIVRGVEPDKNALGQVDKVIDTFSKTDGTETHVQTALEGLHKLGLPEDKQKALVEAFLSALAANVQDYNTAKSQVEQYTSVWRQLQRPQAAASCAASSNDEHCKPPIVAGDQLDFTDLSEPLPALILHRLAQDGRIIANDAGYAIRDPAFAITSLGLRFDDEGVSSQIVFKGDEVAQVESPKIKLSTFKIAFDNETSISLEEIVQFWLGRIKVGDVYLPFEDMQSRDFVRATIPDFADTKSKRDAFSTNIDALVKISAKGGEVLSQVASPQSATLAAKLMRSAVWPCDEIAAAVPQILRTCVKAPPKGTNNGAPKNVWQGFDGGTPPLERLANAASTLSQSANSYQDNRKKLESIITRELHDAVFAIDTPIDLDESAFANMHVIPHVGVALLPREAGTPVTTTTGIQVFLYPNPIDEPMWTNGRVDWARAVGLELAVRPQGASYGPDDRYGPIPNSKLPPVFAGGVLHVIPYTTFSSGVALFGYRRSPLAQERAVLRAGWYVSANVNLNFAGLIQQIRGVTPKATATASEPPKPAEAPQG